MSTLRDPDNLVEGKEKRDRTKMSSLISCGAGDLPRHLHTCRYEVQGCSQYIACCSWYYFVQGGRNDCWTRWKEEWRVLK